MTFVRKEINRTESLINSPMDNLVAIANDTQSDEAAAIANTGLVLGAVLIQLANHLMKRED